MPRRSSKPTEPTLEEITHGITDSLINAAQMFEPIREATNAYRDKCINEGWSQDAAEAMAVQYHAILCQGFLAGVSGGE
jgi:hypothetical protein